MISYAQNLEDVVLNRVFQDKYDGFYIDVGAHDPVELSVTKHFYDLGWRGINIEPVPSSFEKFENERPRDLNLNLAVGSGQGSTRIYEIVGQPEFTTLDKAAAQSAAESLQKEIKTYTVEIHTLAEICEKYCKGPIDFLKIDVEGLEKETILGADFQRFRPIVLVIEATKPGKAIITDWQNPNAAATWHLWEPTLVKNEYIFVYYDGLNRFYLRKEDAHLKNRLYVPISPIQDEFTLYRDVKEKRQLKSEIQHLNKRLDGMAEKIHQSLSETARLKENLVDERRNHLLDLTTVHAQEESRRQSLLGKLLHKPLRLPKIPKRIQHRDPSRSLTSQTFDTPERVAKADDPWVEVGRKLSFGRTIRVVFLNDNGFLYGAGIALKRQVISFLKTGHEVACIAWHGEGAKESEELKDKFGKLWLGMQTLPGVTPLNGIHGNELVLGVADKVNQYFPNIVITGNFHAAQWPIDIITHLWANNLPVFVYCHDRYWMTGRCPVPPDCENYLTGCHPSNCPMGPRDYPRTSPEDIHHEWKKRRAAFTGDNPIPLICNSTWTSKVFQKAFDNAVRPPVIPIGLDLDLFGPHNKQTARQQLELDERPFYVSFGAVNLEDPYEGTEYILSLINHYNNDPGVKFITFGFNSELPGTRSFGYVDHSVLSNIFSASDVFLNLGTEESFGQTVLEACASGCPVITFRVGGTLDIVRHGYNGFVAEFPQVEGVIQYIERLRHSRNTLDKLSTNCRRFVKNNFSYEAQYVEWEKQILSTSRQKLKSSRSFFATLFGRDPFLLNKATLELLTVLDESSIEYEELYATRKHPYANESQLLVIGNPSHESIMNVPESDRHKILLFPPSYSPSISEKDLKILPHVKPLMHCRNASEKLEKKGVRNIHVQAFPTPWHKLSCWDYAEPRSIIIVGYNVEIAWETIKPIIKRCDVKSVGIYYTDESSLSKFGEIHTTDIRDFSIGFFQRTSVEAEDLINYNILILTSSHLIDPFDALFPMSLGMCLFIPQGDFSKEHVRNGVNGYEYPRKITTSLSMDHHNLRTVGNRAKQYIQLGYNRWHLDKNRLLEYFSKAKEDLDEDVFSIASYHHHGPNPSFTSKNSTLPKLTVAIASLNDINSMPKTFESVLEQDYSNVEFIVIDGGSTDGTVDYLKRNDRFLNSWITEKDKGVYDAMNKAAQMAQGEWILFLGAGDYFAFPSSLTDLLAYAPNTADVIYGHVFYKHLNGLEEMSYSEDFESSWSRLLEGNIDWPWINGLPAHQALLMRTELIRELKFDLNYQVSADWELLFRAKSFGANFFNANVLVSVYLAGGFSAQNAHVWIRNIWDFSRQYAKDRLQIDSFFKTEYTNYLKLMNVDA